LLKDLAKHYPGPLKNPELIKMSLLNLYEKFNHNEFEGVVEKKTNYKLKIPLESVETNNFAAGLSESNPILEEHESETDDDVFIEPDKSLKNLTIRVDRLTSEEVKKYCNKKSRNLSNDAENDSSIPRKK